MRRRQNQQSGRSILVVDDDEHVLQATIRLLERDGHEVLGASGGRMGLDIVRARSVDLVLVDYFMPGMTGEEFVAELRSFAPYVQVILQTGYANERPPREMLKRLDIQGYHDKSEGPEKLCLWVDVGLRAAFSVQLLNKSRVALSYILEVTPALHKIQPIEQLLQGILTQTVGLLGVADSLLAVAHHPLRNLGVDGFVAMAQPGGSLRVRAATGKFAGCDAIATAFTSEQLVSFGSAVVHDRVNVVDDGTVVALRIGDATLGFMYLCGRVLEERDRELLAVFANQAAVAIHNASLYELAAVDQLTRAYTRTFFDQSLMRELHNAHRAGAPMSVLVVDIDDMKSLNDRGGHLCGDHALTVVGALLARATRVTDVVGRYGGDEFAVVLPNTDAEGAQVVAARVLEGARTLSAIAADGQTLPVGLTIGVASLGRPATKARCSEAYFASIAKQLIAAADEGMYAGKRTGKGRLGEARFIAWPTESHASRREVA